MILTASSDVALAKREVSRTESGFQIGYTPFIGEDARTYNSQAGEDPAQLAPTIQPTINPMAFLVELEAGSLVRAHFHRVDQFQVVVKGAGMFGIHPVSSIAVHYAGAYSPYGPLKAGDEGLCFFTIRNNYDYGALYMPEERIELREKRPRPHSEFTSEPAPVMGADELAALSKPQSRAVIEQQPNGPAAWRFAVPPSCIMNGPDPAAGGGQSWMVLGGSLMRDGNALSAQSCLFVSCEEAALDLVAGPDGLEILCLQYARYN
jgi:hypothetical protein